MRTKTSNFRTGDVWTDFDGCILMYFLADDQFRYIHSGGIIFRFSNNVQREETLSQLTYIGNIGEMILEFHPEGAKP